MNVFTFVSHKRKDRRKDIKMGRIVLVGFRCSFELFQERFVVGENKYWDNRFIWIRRNPTRMRDNLTIMEEIM